MNQEQLDTLIASLEDLIVQVRALKVPPPSPQKQFITAAKAAEIAKVDVTTIYEWSRHKAWATRPSKRCVRIEESAFRQWLMRC